jgi:hypothetical protein
VRSVIREYFGCKFVGVFEQIKNSEFFEENKRFFGTFRVEQLPGYGSQRGARSIIAGTSVAAGGTGFDISTIVLQRSY